MKKFFRFLAPSLLLAVSLGAISPVAAQEAPCQVDVQVVKVPAAHAALAGSRVTDGAEWARHIHSGEVQLLESATSTGSFNRSGQIHVGSKIPISYSDPRTGSYQVQYVDSGFKVDQKTTEVPGGLFQVDCAVERNAIVEGVPLPSQDCVRTNTIALLKPGQVGIVCSTRGRFTAQYAKHFYPNVVFSENDSLMITISVRKL